MTRTNKKWLLVCIFSCLILFPGPLGGLPLGAWFCQESLAAETVRAVDFRGREIILAAPAKRIVCLIESALSGLYMLGAENRVCGISTNVYQGGVYPYYAAMDDRIYRKTLPTPGNWDFVNLEMVVGLRPDLVIIWSHQEASIQALEEKGIPVYGVFIQKFEDVYRELDDLGRLTGTTRRAHALVRFGKREIDVIGRQIAVVKPQSRRRVYYMWAQGELETSGAKSTVSELISLAGGQNVAGHIQQEHLIVGMEKLLAWNPEVIVMWHNARKGPQDLYANPMWRSVSAVKAGRVFEFPDVFSCDLWTLKYLFAVQMVAQWCYPERFEASGLSETKWRLLKNLYGEKLDAQKVARLKPSQ